MSLEMKLRRVELPGAAPRIDGLVVRHIDVERDVAPLAELLAVVNRNDGVEWVPTAASLAHDLAHTAGQDVTEDVLVAEAGGELVGTVQSNWRVRGERVFHHIEPAVRPDFRRLGLGQALLAWAEAHVVAGLAAGTMGPLDRPHVLNGWADLEIDAVAPFAAATGYTVDHYGVLMARPLDAPLPDVALPAGLEVRPVRPDDHRRIWDADCEAFQDHRDPSVRTEEDFVHWFGQPDIDTSLWEVAWDGEEVAGSVMNFVFPEENARLGLSRGWLEHVSVRRPWRKRGLASALMVRSMHRLRELGLAEAALGADAENLSGAVRLYEALGFRRLRTAASYLKEISVGGA
jgi:ribosomal protein S18 acetylase RimI-like enzyme